MTGGAQVHHHHHQQQQQQRQLHQLLGSYIVNDVRLVQTSRTTDTDRHRQAGGQEGKKTWAQPAHGI